MLTIAAFSLSANAWWSRKAATSKQDLAAAQPTPAAANALRRARLRPQLRDAFGAIGNRLEIPGKERLTLVGNLTRRGQSPAAFRLITQLPNLMRFEEQAGSQVRVIGFDGTNGWVLGSAVSPADLELIEMFVFDSAERFFLGQMEGVATRLLGTRFRADDGKTASYTGPFHDIYQVAERVKIGAAARKQPKLFFVNSDTQLIERVQYETSRGGSAVPVEIRIAWQKTDDQRAPSQIVRAETGQPALTLNVTSVNLGPRANDGIFNKP